MLPESFLQPNGKMMGVFSRGAFPGNSLDKCVELWELAECGMVQSDLFQRLPNWLKKTLVSKENVHLIKIYNGNTCLFHHPLRNIKQQFGKLKIHISIRLDFYLFIIFHLFTLFSIVFFRAQPLPSYWIVEHPYVFKSHRLAGGNRTSTGSRYDFFWCNVECLQEGAGMAMGYVSFKGRTKTPCATVSGTKTVFGG